MPRGSARHLPPSPDEPWPHPACLDDEALLSECELNKGRTRGPGGQHRNKVETHVTLTHSGTGLQGQAGERRTVTDNLRVALRRLRLALAVEVRTPVPVGEVGSALWRSRVAAPPRRAPAERDPVLDSLGVTPRQATAPGAGRLACNPDHHDYPALLAEAMDVLADSAWDPRRAALRLGVSPTQLVKLLRDCPAALRTVNARRERAGAHPLK